jgi:hypothetical protein
MQFAERCVEVGMAPEMTKPTATGVDWQDRFAVVGVCVPGSR